MAKNQEHLFTSQLISWHTSDNNRSLPWKSEKDPYRIWLSEVILQQTRAQQGLPYYLRFTQAFPAVEDLAAANDEQVFRLWQGLGYYNRCKNMLATARYIVNELHGKFPESYAGLLQLKGIGPYTSAAIASFAYGLPHAVVDGNVYRVLGRFWGIDVPYDTTQGKKYFTELAQQLLDITDSAAYNQAIMDLGATICTPRNPLCGQCPLYKKCVASRDHLIDVLPVKSKKLTVRKRYFHYLLLKWDDRLWMHKRTGNDIWENLHEPYLIESSHPLDIKELLLNEQFKNEKINYSSASYVDSSSQRLTHQIIEARFFSFNLENKPEKGIQNGNWLTTDELSNTALPKTVLSFLEKNLYF